MNILFVGDASNFHNTLAAALREMGHEVTVASNGSDWMDTARDINLSRKAGIVGAMKYIYDIIAALPRMRGYDIVHIVNPIFLMLKPEKVRMVFNYLKRNNRYVFLSALGTDYNYVQSCYDGHTFRYSDYMVGKEASPFMLSTESVNQGNWFQPYMKRHSEYITSQVAGIVACLYEYYATYSTLTPSKLAYGGIPIDTRSVQPRIITEVPDKVRFFIGVQRNRNVLKGTDLLLAALKRTHDRFPDKCEMCVVENLPYNEYIQRLSSSHVILDQLYSYTPATNALLAMARGLVAVSGGEPEYYAMIGERDCQPIINVSPLEAEDIDNKLTWIIENRDRLPGLSRMSREFVVKHNDSRTVAQRHIDFWTKIITK